MKRKKPKKSGKHSPKTAPAAVEVEVEPMTRPSSMGSWDSLPPELQEMILEYVQVGSLKTQLILRLVHPNWRDFVDSSLEKKCLSLWTTWNPFSDRCSSPETRFLSIPVMKPVLVWRGTDINFPKGISLTSGWNHSSLPIVENPKLGSPFPGSSIQIKIDYEKYPRAYWELPKTFENPENPVTMVKDLILNFGHYLTSLVLSEFKDELKFLCEILPNLKNLKMLAVNYAMLLGSSTDDLPPLPNLPKLTHLKIFSITSGVSQLLLNEYSGQLVSLETSTVIRSCQQPFSKLRELKLQANIKPNLRFPQLGPNPFPVLENFSVTHINQAFQWRELMEQMDSFPRTLVHLHLDVRVEREEESEEFIGNLNEQEGAQNFTKLKTLGIFYPQSRREAEKIGRLILPKFPNVQELNLMRIQDDFGEEELECLGEWVCRCDTDKKTVIRRMLDVGGFWRVCPKLEKILVHFRGDTRDHHVFTRKTDYGEK